MFRTPHWRILIQIPSRVGREVIKLMRRLFLSPLALLLCGACVYDNIDEGTSLNVDGALVVGFEGGDTHIPYF